MTDIHKRGKPRRPASSATGLKPDRLSDIAEFAPNPGALWARTYVPAGLPGGAALVVVLHGCLQTAAGYDHGAGWSTLADAHGFALLFPEQRRENNPNACFNWFQPADIRRGEGEVASIRAMIAAMVAAHAIDPARVFIAGLSAGGAMAGAMLAVYPEVFAGGAIIAGLPVGAASNLQEAMRAMRGTAYDSGTLTASARAAAAHKGPWPRVSVWHGDADQVVVPGNADAIVAQWLGVRGLTSSPTRIERAHGRAHRVWRDADGNDAIEQWTIAGMGHGTPIHPDGAPGGGAAMPYMLDVGFASTRHIAAFWGLVPETAARAASDASPPIAAKRPARVLTPEPLDAAQRHHPPKGVAQVIDEALRVAGLRK